MARTKNVARKAIKKESSSDEEKKKNTTIKKTKNTGISKGEKTPSLPEKTMASDFDEKFYKKPGSGRDYQSDEAMAHWFPNLSTFAWKVKGKYGPVIQAQLRWIDNSVSEIWFQGKDFVNKMQSRTEKDTPCAKKDCIYCGRHCNGDESEESSFSEDEEEEKIEAMDEDIISIKQ